MRSHISPLTVVKTKERGMSLCGRRLSTQGVLRQLGLALLLFECTDIRVVGTKSLETRIRCGATRVNGIPSNVVVLIICFF
jgi:hypothetical protein